ncbi:hypothetical protein FY034_02760 [Trichlorobacter lovleyi]|uniref:hypothetical protein n=1 Tax=Trichlorobacter lovleyi TaxID=313985 RepID=UPI002240D4CC|nr:hypothetical protein [Trichlorobacter lovleyi]QOX77906.1 hypothetical protein FY034_02760 [Trichlorobacter lovleyi]
MDKLIIIVLAVFVVLGCNPVSREELKRTTSPDSIVDAVLVQVNGGATTSFIYELYVVKKGANITEGSALLRADHVDGLLISWRQPKLLDIKYAEARIHQFTNFWHSKDVNNFKYIVELRLIPQHDIAINNGVRH